MITHPYCQHTHTYIVYIYISSPHGYIVLQSAYVSAKVDNRICTYKTRNIEQEQPQLLPWDPKLPEIVHKLLPNASLGPQSMAQKETLQLKHPVMDRCCCGHEAAKAVTLATLVTLPPVRLDSLDVFNEGKCQHKYDLHIWYTLIYRRHTKYNSPSSQRLFTVSQRVQSPKLLLIRFSTPATHE